MKLQIFGPNAEKFLWSVFWSGFDWGSHPQGWYFLAKNYAFLTPKNWIFVNPRGETLDKTLFSDRDFCHFFVKKMQFRVIFSIKGCWMRQKPQNLWIKWNQKGRFLATVGFEWVRRNSSSPPPCPTSDQKGRQISS